MAGSRKTWGANGELTPHETAISRLASHAPTARRHPGYPYGQHLLSHTPGPAHRVPTNEGKDPS
jgi:hypothetical protein